MEKSDLISFTKCVVIGGSAGSLRIILHLVETLKAGLPFPVVVVIHRKNDTSSSLEQLLNDRASFLVKEAEDKEQMHPGVMYLAPPDYHLLVEKDGSLSLDASEKILWSRPSIDVTFQSVAEVFGAATLGILLSGANSDGALGLEFISQCGGITLIQDPANAEIPAMPLAALERHQPQYLLPDHKIAEVINKF